MPGCDRSTPSAAPVASRVVADVERRQELLCELDVGARLRAVLAEVSAPCPDVANLDVVPATIDLAGVRKEISVALVPDVVPGDYVIVHVGYALQKLDAEEAQRTLELFAGAGLAA